MMKTRLLIISSICIFFTISVVVLSTQFFYVFDDGILPIAIHSKEDIHRLENTPEQLERIFSDCACVNKINKYPEPDQLCLDLFSSWQNDTHYIDNNLCKFLTHEEYDQYTNLKNALKKCWVGNSEYLDDDFVLWDNETHYVNTDTCLITEVKNEN